MFRAINWTGSLLGWVLIVYGVQTSVLAGVGAYMVSNGQILPGTRMFFDAMAPDVWEAVEQIAGGFTSVLFGLGALKLVSMRKASRLDDLTKESQAS